ADHWLLGRSRSQVAVALALIVLASGGAPAPVQAANVFTTSSGSWIDPGTWSTGVVPSAGDRVFVGPGHTVTIEQEVAADVWSVVVESGGVLRIDSAGALVRDAVGDVSGWVTVHGALLVHGVLGSTSAGAAASEDLLLRTTAGSWLE